MISSKFKQAGNFTVEFALIGVFFSLLLVFSGDVIIKLSVKGKLERLSFSLVSVLKERTQLYDDNYQITADEAGAIQTIAKNSLKRTLGAFVPADFSILVEGVTFSDEGIANSQKFPETPQTCAVAKSLESLSFATSWGRQASLYRVTLCYETENWFGKLLGKKFTTVSSSSVMIGR